jgi:hypothetical protein
MAPPFTLSRSSRDAELVAAVDDLHGEGLVEFPQADVVDLQAVARSSSLGIGEDRADAHLVRLAAGDGEAAEDAERLEAALLGELRVHHHAGRGAVRELAGVAGGDHAALGTPA